MSLPTSRCVSVFGADPMNGHKVVGQDQYLLSLFFITRMHTPCFSAHYVGQSRSRHQGDPGSPIATNGGFLNLPQ